MGLMDWGAALGGVAALGRGSGAEGGSEPTRGRGGLRTMRQEVLSLMSGSGARSPRSGALRGVGSKAGYRGPPAPEVEARAS